MTKFIINITLILNRYLKLKQIIQDLKNGKTILEDVPSPQVKKGSFLLKLKEA